LHAGSARDALGRLELLLARAGELSSAAITRHVARAVDVIVHLDRHPDGRRVVREIARVEDEVATIVWSHDR
jgi:pilus assembly protein CpaF